MRDDDRTLRTPGDNPAVAPPVTDPAREHRAHRDVPEHGTHGNGEHAARVAAERAKSFPRLVRDMIDETRTLIQNEVRLARVESREILGVIQRNLVSIGIGAGIGLGALLALVLAANGALTALFLLWLSPVVTVWLAPLVVAIVFGLVAWGLIKKGTSAIRRHGLHFEKTADSLKEDKEWLRRRVS